MQVAETKGVKQKNTYKKQRCSGQIDKRKIEPFKNVNRKKGKW